MNIRGIAAVWAVCCAVIAIHVSEPTFLFTDLAWWRAGWWVAAAALTAVSLGLRRLRVAMLFAAAPPIVRALILSWFILRVDPYGADQFWIKVALYAALTAGVSATYSHAAALRAVDDAADRA